MTFSSNFMVCQHCRAPLHESSKFCNACGTRVLHSSANDQTANRLGASRIDGMKQCPFCAEDIKQEAIKCRYCGSMLSRSVSVTPGSFQQENTSRTINHSTQKSKYENKISDEKNNHGSLRIKWPLIILTASILVAGATAYLIVIEKRSADVDGSAKKQENISTRPAQTEVKNAPFAGKWGDRSSGGQAALFLFIQQEGNSIKAWYLAKDPSKAGPGSDHCDDLKNPGITGFTEGNTAHVNYHTSSGAGGKAILKLADNKLLWNIEQPEPSILNSTDINSCFLPDTEKLEKDIEPSADYWDTHLFKKALTNTTEIVEGSESSQQLIKSCRDFVSKFYNSSWQADGKPHPDGFSPELFKLVNDDYLVSKSSQAHGNCLDFDPVLNSNDGKSAKYVLGKSSAKNNRYFVEVYGTSNGKINKRPAVVPELALKDGNWLFVNFGYPKDGEYPATNLINLLNQLAQERHKRSNGANNIPHKNNQKQGTKDLNNKKSKAKISFKEISN